MTESLPPDADVLETADTDEPPLEAVPPLEPVPTEPVVPIATRPAAGATGRGPSVLLGYLAAALAGALLLAGSLAAFGGLGRPVPLPSPTPTPPPNAAIGPSLGSAAAPV